MTPSVENKPANTHTYSSAFVQQPLFPGSAALPFVISTGAERSGEICGSAVLSWKCFSTEGIMGPPPKATKNRFCSLTTIPGKRRPPLCHLDRSAAQWRDLRFQRSSHGNVFLTKRGALRCHTQAYDVGRRDDDQHPGPEQPNRFGAYTGPFAERQT